MKLSRRVAYYARGKRGEEEALRLTLANVQRINKFRNQMDLAPIEMKERNCLKCGNLFFSEAINERLCGKHRKRDDSASRTYQVIIG
jgi:uncharacterized protein (UPF0212 family)